VQGPGASVRVEPIQIIQAIAVGIGFLGAGVIRAGGEGRPGTGLTTAASIWGTAAIGVATALQHYLLALAATLLFVAVLRGLEPLEKKKP
jgi:putative Mg2+ transporter-C (MgtC) family protein